VCSTCDSFEARVTAGTVAVPGGVAQLVERLHGMQEVSWVRVPSPPLFSSFLDGWRSVGFFLGGLVAGEGSFVVTTAQPPFRDGAPRLRFVFQLSMATRDRLLLEAMQGFLGCGSISDHPPRRAGWEPISAFTVSSRRAHFRSTLPFGDHFMPFSAKRVQFDRWSAALRSYEELRPSRWGKGPSPCKIEGCERPVRGRGLCRSHYYRATGY
jgi:hypothetical protein